MIRACLEADSEAECPALAGQGADRERAARHADVLQEVGELRLLSESAFREDSVRPVFAVLGNDTRYRLARILATTSNGATSLSRWGVRRTMSAQPDGAAKHETGISMPRMGDRQRRYVRFETRSNAG